MANLLVRRDGELTPAPWRNGRGVTREVARGPAGAGPEEFDWRISIADVSADGPFSTYPGIDRIILLARGDWMTLTVDGTAHRLAPHQPFAFDGSSSTTCQIPAPTRDVNVMTRRGRATATLQVMSVTGPCGVAGAEPLVLIGLAGAVTVRAAVGGQAEMGPLDALVWALPDALTIDGAGTVAAVRIGGTGEA